jgi:phosphomevalonate kinase
VAEYAGASAVVADRERWMVELFRLHREFQGGHGSGADVAAALAGGLIRYRLEDGRRPQHIHLDWPSGLHAQFIWTGQPASTGGFLKRLAQWRQGHLSEHAAHFAGLTRIAESGVAALAAGQAAEFVRQARDYSDALHTFGSACGLSIFSAEHIQLQRLAQAAGVFYKPCGAGGGDFGVVFATDPLQLARAGAAIAEAGFRSVPLKIDPNGLRLECIQH